MIEHKPCNLVIFGAKGDLAARKLLPALYQLENLNQLHNDTRIIGIGRANWNKDDYISIVIKTLEKFKKNKTNNFILEKLCSRLDFCNIDFQNISQYIKLKKILNHNTNIYYLAVPPNIFGSICQGLGKYQLNNIPSRIIIEKPLGTSLCTSQKINHEISMYFQEKQIFRIDHYLGKETILNLLSLRFSNTIFSSYWDYKVIDHIQITVSETVGIEGRWNYFDKSGQIRDMLQNHLLQILTLITMAPPINLNTHSIQSEKIKILHALRPINHSNIDQQIVLGQYTSGILNNVNIPSYINEENANQNSQTETFVCAKINIDNCQWHGVPFYIRTGKRLPIKCSEVVIVFKKPTFPVFIKNYTRSLSNKLIIRLQPNEGITLQILNKKPSLGSKYTLQNINLDFKYSNYFENNIFDAYERLLLEMMRGNQTLFVSRNEIETSWKWIDSIIHALKIKKIHPELYNAGTWGPKSSFDMIEKDGRNWN